MNFEYPHQKNFKVKYLFSECDNSMSQLTFNTQQLNTSLSQEQVISRK